MMAWAQNLPICGRLFKFCFIGPVNINCEAIVNIFLNQSAFADYLQVQQLTSEDK